MALTNDAFFTRLAVMFSDTQASGSVWLTTKRGALCAPCARARRCYSRAACALAERHPRPLLLFLSRAPPRIPPAARAAAAKRGAAADAASRLLVRASTGRRGVPRAARGARGACTYVEAADVAAFSAALTTALRAGTPALKRREREKKEKGKKEAKAEAKASAS